MFHSNVGLHRAWQNLYSNEDPTTVMYASGSFSANCRICSCSQSRHMDFNFPYKYGLGISSMMKHASKGCADLVMQLCAYDPDERLSAKHALRHPYFKDIRWAQQEYCRVPFGVHCWDGCKVWDAPRVNSSFNMQKETSLITNMFGKYCLLRTKKACPIQPEGHDGSGSGHIFNA